MKLKTNSILLSSLAFLSLNAACFASLPQEEPAPNMVPVVPAEVVVPAEENHKSTADSLKEAERALRPVVKEKHKKIKKEAKKAHKSAKDKLKKI
jgi:hypothetical protein